MRGDYLFLAVMLTALTVALCALLTLGWVSIGPPHTTTQIVGLAASHLITAGVGVLAWVAWGWYREEPSR